VLASLIDHVGDMRSPPPPSPPPPPRCAEMEFANANRRTFASLPRMRDRVCAAQFGNAMARACLETRVTASRVSRLNRRFNLRYFQKPARSFERARNKTPNLWIAPRHREDVKLIIRLCLAPIDELVINKRNTCVAFDPRYEHVASFSRSLSLSSSLSRSR